MEAVETIVDYSDAKNQGEYELIPDGTVVKVKFEIKEGNYNDPSRGWNKGLATQGQSGAVYLNTINTVIAGEHKDKKIFNLIGLYSPKGETYREMGRTYIKAILDSAHGIDPNDHSAIAQKKRQATWTDLTKLVHLVEVGTKHDQKGNLRNEIKKVITPNDIRYHEYMGINIEDDFDDEIKFNN